MVRPSDHLTVLVAQGVVTVACKVCLVVYDGPCRDKVDERNPTGNRPFPWPAEILGPEAFQTYVRELRTQNGQSQ